MSEVPPTQPLFQVRDPLRTFQFRLAFASGPKDYFVGVRSVSGLGWSLGVHEAWEGGNNLHRYANPDKLTWEPITLEYGLALGDTLVRWAQAGQDFALQDPPKGLFGLSPLPMKNNLVLDVWDPRILGYDPPASAGGSTVSRLMLQFTVFNAWVSKFKTLPKLDAGSSEFGISSVEIVHEGWQFARPLDPSSTPP